MAQIFKDITKDELIEVLQVRYKEKGSIRFYTSELSTWINDMYNIQISNRSLGKHLVSIQFKSAGIKANRRLWVLDSDIMLYVFTDDPFFKVSKAQLIELLQKKYLSFGSHKFTAAECAGWIYGEYNIPLGINIVHKQLLILGIKRVDVTIPTIFMLTDLKDNLMVAI